jgi:hypothetical protein
VESLGLRRGTRIAVEDKSLSGAQGLEMLSHKFVDELVGRKLAATTARIRWHDGESACAF